MLSSKTPQRLLAGSFAVFFVGRTVDLVGSSMTTLALALAVLQVGAGPRDLGVILAASTIPTLLFLLVGGAVADRFSRKLLLVGTNLASGVVMAALAVIFLSGHYSLHAVAGLALVRGVLEGFSSPALRGLVPELVAKRDLQQANAMLASSKNATRIIAPALAAVIVAGPGGGWALAVDAGTYLLAGLVFLKLPATKSKPPARQSILNDLKEGWSVFWTTRWIVTMSFSYLVINACMVGPWNVLGPEIVLESGGPVGWGIVQSVRAAGLLVMSFVAIKIVFSKPLRDGELWGLLGAAPLFALAWANDTWVIAVAAFVGGIGVAVGGVTWDTALQSAIPKNQISRVAAYDDLFSYVAIPVSQVGVGFVAVVADSREVCLVVGVCYVLARLVPLVSRNIRQFSL